MMWREPVLISTVTAMPGSRFDHAVVDLHLRLIERHAGGIDQLLPLGLAGVAFVAGGLPCRRFYRRASSRTMASCDTGCHLAVNEPVAGEVERVDLDLGVLPFMDEADIAVGDHRLDFKMAVGGHDRTCRTCAGVTTPPCVCTASCCTVPSTGAVRV